MNIISWPSAVGLIVTLLPGLLPAPAMSQPTAPGALGKTCRGVFTISDGPPNRQQGAFQIHFAGTAEKPTAHLWRGFGAALSQTVGAEVDSRKLSSDLTGFDDLGPARDVVVQGNQVSFTTSRGAGLTFLYDSTSPSIYDGTTVISTPAPGEPPGRMDWRGGSAYMLCQ